MNIWQKKQAITERLAKAGIKMSGKNTFANYGYYELSDINPHLIPLLTEFACDLTISFDEKLATATLTNCEKPEERIVITSPMGSAELKGCHVVQNIGAVETYQRRYLELAMFNISEADALNASHNPDATDKPASRKVVPFKADAPRATTPAPSNDAPKQGDDKQPYFRFSPEKPFLVGAELTAGVTPINEIDFGKNKGKTLSELTENQLRWYWGSAYENIIANKYLEKSVAQLLGVQAELVNRGHKPHAVVAGGAAEQDEIPME